VNRNERNLQQKKQEKAKVADGYPSLNEIIEGKFQFRYIKGTLYLVTRCKNKLWYFTGSESI